MKAYWVSGGITPRILDLGTRWCEWSASRPGCFTSRERTDLPILRSSTNIINISHGITKIWYVITCLLTYSMVQDFLWKSDSHSASQTIGCFLHGTWRFTTVLRKARHRTPSRASRIQFAPSIPISQRSISIPFPTHAQVFPAAPLPGPPKQNPVNTFLLSTSATCPAHSTLPDLITQTILSEEYRPWSSSLCNTLHALSSSRSKHPPQHPAPKKPQSTFLPQHAKLQLFYILIFSSFDMKWEDTKTSAEWQ
jgi:hypothetical protein